MKNKSANPPAARNLVVTSPVSGVLLMYQSYAATRFVNIPNHVLSVAFAIKNGWTPFYFSDVHKLYVPLFKNKLEVFSWKVGPSNP